MLVNKDKKKTLINSCNGMQNLHKLFYLKFNLYIIQKISNILNKAKRCTVMSTVCGHECYLVFNRTIAENLYLEHKNISLYTLLIIAYFIVLLTFV